MSKRVFEAYVIFGDLGWPRDEPFALRGMPVHLVVHDGDEMLRARTSPVERAYVLEGPDGQQQFVIETGNSVYYLNAENFTEWGGDTTRSFPRHEGHLMHQTYALLDAAGEEIDPARMEVGQQVGVVTRMMFGHMPVDGVTPTIRSFHVNEDAYGRRQLLIETDNGSFVLDARHAVGGLLNKDEIDAKGAVAAAPQDAAVTGGGLRDKPVIDAPKAYDAAMTAGLGRPVPLAADGIRPLNSVNVEDAQGRIYRTTPVIGVSVGQGADGKPCVLLETQNRVYRVPANALTGSVNAVEEWRLPDIDKGGGSGQGSVSDDSQEDAPDGFGDSIAHETDGMEEVLEEDAFGDGAFDGGL